MRYLEKVIIPYKEAKIHELGLPVDQVTILKHDLHYSHKDPAVLELMRLFNIKPLFVPAGCTDYMQECDVVINAPFKKAVREAFRNYLHEEFAQFSISFPDRVDEWVPNLNAGHLKPVMTSWIINGIQALKTLSMKEAIVKAFAKQGCFEAIRQRADNNRDVARNFEQENATLFGSGTEVDDDQEIEEIAGADDDLVPEEYNEEQFETEEAQEEERLVLRFRITNNRVINDVAV